MLQALSYAHRNGVIHQDIKPANIMLSDDKIVKLTDFESRLFHELPGHSSDVVMGTPKCISPGTAQGSPVDERCDIYSFRITLHEMLTGMLPYPLDGILHHHLVTPALPIRSTPRSRSNWSESFLRCLETANSATLRRRPARGVESRHGPSAELIPGRSPCATTVRN